jgi:DNA-binding response OmpR family regulator
VSVMRGADRLTLEVHGDRDLDVRVAAVLALDFDVRLIAESSGEPDAIFLTASRATFRAHIAELKQRTGAPILLVLADPGVFDAGDALQVGAGDVLAAPCDPYEALARLRGLVSRARRERGTPDTGDLEIDVEHGVARKGRRRIGLSSTEAALLAALTRRAGGAASIEQLKREVWGGTCSTATIHRFIYYLRAKLSALDDRPLIETVRGAGYALRRFGSEVSCPGAS